MKPQTMIGLEGTELVLRITGEVQSSNLVEFEKTALEVIGNINLELNTDADFKDAKANIKACKLLETRIGNARQDALHSTADISKLIEITARLEGKFRETRLDLGKTVKAEDLRLKKEIVDDGLAELERIFAKTTVNEVYYVSEDVRDAIKNKRSYDSMRLAVKEVVDENTERLREVEKLFAENSIAIRKSLLVYPGLYPDINTLALKTLTEVTLTITSREEKFKNDKRAADERKAVKAKAEAEEKRLADERQAAKEKAKTDKQTEVLFDNDPPVKYEPLMAERASVEPPTPPKPFVKPPPPLADLPPDFNPTVVISVEIEEYRASEISCKIANIDGVILVK